MARISFILILYFGSIRKLWKNRFLLCSGGGKGVLVARLHQHISTCTVLSIGWFPAGTGRLVVLLKRVIGGENGMIYA